jgi:hypothetical protein
MCGDHTGVLQESILARLDVLRHEPFELIVELHR